MNTKMTMLDASVSGAFLAQYKRLLGRVAGKPLNDSDAYSKARETLYKDGFNKSYVFDPSYHDSFVSAVRAAISGTFVYAKKYACGYAFKAPDGSWLCVKALTTPLEEMLPEWIVVDTAILPYRGVHVCDGLIVNRNMYIGPNMIRSMTQELKVERAKWTSAGRRCRGADEGRS